MIYDCVNLNFIDHFNALFVFYIFTSFLPTAYLFKKNYDPPHFFNKLSISLFPVDPKQFLFKFLSKNSLYNIICMPPGQHGGEGAGADIPPQRPQG